MPTDQETKELNPSMPATWHGRALRYARRYEILQPNSFVTIRFQRLSPDSRSNMEGFFFQYGCSGQHALQSSCKNPPVLLMTSNIAQSAACTEHIGGVLNGLIDGVLASKNGEKSGGFLRKLPDGDVDSFIFDSEMVEATDEVIWQSRLDRKYDVLVFASTTPYKGVFVLRDGETELSRRTVHLAYNAFAGPDVADTAAWQDAAIAMIDGTKSPKQRLDEALDRIKKERNARIKRLRTVPDGGKAYQLALDALRYPEVAVDWLISPNAALNRKAPADLLVENDGLDRIEQLLENVIKTIYPLT